MGEDADIVVVTGVPRVLPFCLTWGLSLSSAFTDSLPMSLLTSLRAHSLVTQPGCW